MVRQGEAVIREPGDRRGGVDIPDPDLHRRPRGALDLPRAEEAAVPPLQIRFPEAADRMN